MHTDKKRSTGFLRPPGMAEVRKTQEQFSGRPPWMAGVPGAKPSVNEASFTGQTQEQFFRFNL
jgi:hypothetical protein